MATEAINMMKSLSGGKKMKVCVLGGAGFIGSHIAKRLKDEGHHVVSADWKKCQYYENSEYCDEFYLVDLRTMENSKKVPSSPSPHHRHTITITIATSIIFATTTATIIVTIAISITITILITITITATTSVSKGYGRLQLGL
jgi:predicted dinucleotide-binding enzyme